MAQQPGTRRKKKKRSALYGPLSFIIVCAALIFAMSVFFRVSNIEVIGASTYTAEEIIEASGIEEGDNLFFINRSTTTSRIFSKLPYIEEVAITRYLPNKIVLEVTEGKAIAYVNIENDLWMIDRGCKLLGKTSAAQVGGLIRVTGISGVSPVEGERLKTDETEAAKIEFLSLILKEMVSRDMHGDVTLIDMSNLTSPSFDYLGRFTVRLGRNDSVDYKFELLMSAVSQLAPGDMGTIDLTTDKQVSFSPD